MQAAATETITLGALAMRLGDRVDSVAVCILGSKADPEVAFGRDCSGLVKRYYSAEMVWNQLNADEGVYQTAKWHTKGGKKACVQLWVKGGGKE